MRGFLDAWRTGDFDLESVEAQWDATGVRPTFMDRLESAGVRLPSSAFRERVMLKD